MERRTFCGISAITALSGCTAITEDFSNDQLGQQFTTNDGLELTVDRVEAQTGGSIALDESDISGSEDITFVLPHLVATNTTESTLSLPLFDNFVLNAGGRRRGSYRTDYTDVIDTIGSSITEPVSGPLFPSVPEIGPDEQAEGWLVFRAPSGDSTVTLEARIDGSDVIQWSLQI